jgi:hypothetical protein
MSKDGTVLLTRPRTTGSEVPRCESNHSRTDLASTPHPKPSRSHLHGRIWVAEPPGCEFADCQQVPTCLQIGAGRGWIESRWAWSNEAIR